jgi:hypothetical protein
MVIFDLLRQYETKEMRSPGAAQKTKKVKGLREGRNGTMNRVEIPMADRVKPTLERGG